MNCSNCGNVIPQGKKFCGYCGAKVLDLKAEGGSTSDAQTEKTSAVRAFPQWLFWLIPIVVIGVGLLLAISLGWIPTARQDTGESGLPGMGDSPEDVQGVWAGEIHGTDGFSAEIEIAIEEGCRIGRKCGTFRLTGLDNNGELELLGINGMIYSFLENPAHDENSEGLGYQIMSRLDDQTLDWTFERRDSSGNTLYESSGVLTLIEN